MSDDFTTKKPLLRLMIVFLILTLPSLVLIPNPAGASGTDCTDPLITDFNPAYKFDQGDASYRWVTSMKLNYHDPPGIGVDLLWWDYTWPPSPEHLKPRIPDENDQVHFWMDFE